MFGRMASGVAVRDLRRALDFYRGVLGMRVTFENGDPVGFAILKRDAAELHLTVAVNHRASTHNVAHLMVSDATALHDHLVANGTRIVKGLRDADYGLRASFSPTLMATESMSDNNCSRRPPSWRPTTLRSWVLPGRRLGRP